MAGDKTVLVTVGSTRFDALISSVQQEPVQRALASQGFSRIVVQYGGSQGVFSQWVPIDGMHVSGFSYSGNIEEQLHRSSLVISHAGSGSIIEALELRKKLIVVANETLMDNHQRELTQAMADGEYLISSTPENLLYAIQDLGKKELRPFLFSSKPTFQTILDSQMGFS